MPTMRATRDSGSCRVSGERFIVAFGMKRALHADVAVAETCAARAWLRDHPMKLLLSARHSDIEQPALFLDLRRQADAKVRRYAAIREVENVRRRPFLTFDEGSRIR